MEAISQSGLSVGLLTSEGVILAAEKKMSSKLLDTGKKPEKMYKIDDHIACAVAGITSDANILVNFCRLTSQRYLFQYDEAVPMEHLNLKTHCSLVAPCLLDLCRSSAPASMEMVQVQPRLPLHDSPRLRRIATSFQALRCVAPF